MKAARTKTGSTKRPAPSVSASASLLLSLSEIAARVQRARTVEQVLSTAGEGLLAIGILFSAAELHDGGVVVRLMVGARAVREKVEPLLGRSLNGFRGALPPGSPGQRALAERRCVLAEDLSTWIASYFSELDPQFVKQLYEENGLGRGVLAPIYLGEVPWGIAMLASETLSEADLPALSLFASQLSSAVESASAIESFERRTQQLNAIHAVATVGSAQNLEALLPNLLEIAAHATESELSLIHLLDPEREELVMTTPPFGQAEVPDGYRRVPLAASWLGLSERKLKPVAFRLGDCTPEIAAQMRAQGFLEAAQVPLHVSGKLSGCLHLLRRSPRPYTDSDLRSAEILAGQIAIQIDNARLYADAQRRVRQLSLLFNLSRIGTEEREVKPLVYRMLEQVLEALSVDHAAIHSYTEGRLITLGVRGKAAPLESVKGLESLPVDRGSAVGWAALERRTVQVAVRDLPQPAQEVARQLGFAQVTATPLMVSQRLFGVFSVARRVDTPFSGEELRLFLSCAAQMAIAIERAQLDEAERRRMLDLSLINELGGLIARDLDRSHVFSTAVRYLSRITEVPHVFVMLIDEDKRSLRIAASNVGDKTIDIRLGLDEPSAVAAAFHSLKPVAVNDAASDERATRALVERFGHRSLLAIPLISEGRPMGVVLMGDNRSSRRFHVAEVDRAVALSNQLATALANAQLFQDLKTSYEKLERAQAEVVKHERLAAVGEIAAVMAHEVRNPLGVIFNSLGQLKKQLQPTGDAKLLLQIVGEEADRLNRIVGDLLDFARPYEPVAKVERLDTVIGGAVEAARRAVPDSPVQVELEPIRDLDSFAMDGHLIRQALINLIINAMQSMPRGGKVTVRAVSDVREGQPGVRIDVCDQGVGVAAADAERIFEPFFTTKASGTGLGLAVVKRIVDAHKGEIWAHAAPDGGTIFSVRLPGS